MKRRCYSESDSHYKDYGARGINMCDEWREDYSKFREWATENGYQKGLSIDRIDVNSGYSPKIADGRLRMSSKITEGVADITHIMARL